MSDLQLAQSTSLTHVNISTFYDSKTRTSFCWKYFGNLVVTNDAFKKKVISTGHVYCLACLDKVKREVDKKLTFGSVKIKSYNISCSTSNLTKHLRDEHDLFEDVTDKIKKEKEKPEIKKTKPVRVTRQTESLNNSIITYMEIECKSSLDKNLVKWLCKSLIPFDYVSDEGMIDFFKKYKIIVTNDELPSRESLSNEVLDDLYENLLSSIKETICADAPQHVGLTLDIWTDQWRGVNNVTFTLNYLVDNFQFKRMTLTTKQIINETYKDDIKEIINQIIQEFDLNNIKIHLVSDHEVNLTEIEGIDNHSCYGHGFHKLLTVDGIKNVPELNALIQKCKNVVKTLPYNIPVQEIDIKPLQKKFITAIEDIIEIVEIDERNALSDDIIENGEEKTPSRWHVLTAILDCITQVKSRDTINNTLKKLNKDISFDANEWNTLKNFNKFIKSFEEAIQVFVSQDSCNINVALLFRTEIMDVLNSINQDDEIIYNLAKNMIDNINKRLPVTKAIVAAALLDSRFTNLKEIDTFLATQNLDRTEFLSKYIKEVLNINGAVNEDNDGDSLLHKLSLKHQPFKVMQDDPIDQECWRYMSSANPFQLKNAGLLTFWNKNKNNFPWIASLAKELLCITATNDASENMFSVKGLEFIMKRSRLNPRLLNKVIFVHDNCNMDEVIDV